MINNYIFRSYLLGLAAVCCILAPHLHANQEPILETKPNSTHVTVVIDVFRAFTTACYILKDHPAMYLLATKSSVIDQLAQFFPHPVLIGKGEIGASLAYAIPNSPTRVCELDLSNRSVLHRSAAGARGVLLSKEADLILAASFVNATATVRYIQTLTNPVLTFLPMGHEGITPSLEDNLCTAFIEGLLRGERIEIASYVEAIREDSGKYFFSEDQRQYPQEDFTRCLEIDRFNFAIQAVVHEDYAILNRLDASSSSAAERVRQESQIFHVLAIADSLD
jgi:2-phosphosulfolactate phosphatase